MKIKLVLMALLLCNLNFLKSQTATLYKETTLGQKPVSWIPVQIATDGGNIIKGVQIYSYETECSSEKVQIVKLINTNLYSVLLSYQLGINDPVVEVTIPASFSIEGDCSSSDINLKKLLISFPAKTEVENNKLMEYIRSHISVNPL